MLAAFNLLRVTVVSFGNFSRGPVDGSNRLATSRETTAKFSAVRLLQLWSDEFLERSSTAPILDPESELCAPQTIGSHTKLTHRWLAPHHQLPALSGDTSFPPWHVDVGWQGERLSASGTEPFTPVRESQENSRIKAGSGTAEDGAWQIYHAVDLQRPLVIDLSAPFLLPRHTRLLVMMRRKLTGYSVNE